MRLDVLVTLLPPERSLVVAPHGILGQSFDGSGIAVDGAVDPHASGSSNDAGIGGSINIRLALLIPIHD